MKTSTFVLDLLLVHLTLGVSLNPLTGNDGTQGRKPLVQRQAGAFKLHKIENLPPLSGRPGAKRQKLYYGPITLRPAKEKKAKTFGAMDPNSNIFSGVPDGLPRDITLLFHNTTLQYEDGRVADQGNGVYNHHTVFIHSLKRVPQIFSCNGRAALGDLALPAPSTPIGGSEDVSWIKYTTPDWKFNSGYIIGKTDTFSAMGEVINYADEPKKIFVVPEIEYVPGKPEGVMDVSIQLLGATQCDSLSSGLLRPPPGQKAFSFKSKNISVLQNGYILSRRGHLHDGGVNIEINVNGRLICDSRATYGGEKGTLKTSGGKGAWETISSISECPNEVKVTKGDNITVQAHYDLEKHPLREHADHSGMAELMGLMSFPFALSV